YSAVVDRAVHFHLLHKKDHVRVQQRMLNPQSGQSVEHGEIRKGYPIDKTTYVLLDEDEIAQLVAESSRTIQVSRFVPSASISLEWYDRPYYLGPTSGHEKEYGALAGALANHDRRGILHWVMRKKEYAGALYSDSGHLLLITLHHTGEVVAI